MIQVLSNEAMRSISNADLTVVAKGRSLSEQVRRCDALLCVLGHAISLTTRDGRLTFHEEIWALLWVLAAPWTLNFALSALSSALLLTSCAHAGTMLTYEVAWGIVSSGRSPSKATTVLSLVTPLIGVIWRLHFFSVVDIHHSAAKSRLAHSQVNISAVSQRPRHHNRVGRHRLDQTGDHVALERRAELPASHLELVALLVQPRCWLT